MTHPSAEEVAEHLEGVLDPGSDRRVREHLRDCADCAGVARDLAGVPALLRAAATAVPPMPADLARRVESALAEESRARPPADRDVLPRHAGVSAVERPTQRVWRRRAAVGLLAAAAVTVVAVSVGDVLPTGFSGGSAGESATAGRAAPESQAQAEAPRGPGSQGEPRGTGPADGAQLGPQALQDGAGGETRLRSLTGAALIDAVAAAHTPGSASRDRAVCVAAALRDTTPAGAARAGSSYAVTLPGRPDGVPGAVWLRPRGAPTQGVLVACEPRPRVLLRRGLSD